MIKKQNKKHKVPNYFLFRIIFLAGVMYTLLVLPFGALVRYSQFADYISFDETEQLTDSITNQVKKEHKIEINIKDGEKNYLSEKFSYQRPELISRDIHNILFLVSMIAYVVINWRFRRYFKLKKKGKKIPEHIRKYVRKHFVKMPYVNVAVAFSLPLLTQISGLIEVMHKPDFETDPNLWAEKQLFFINMIATVLTAVFVYYWQKNRQQFLYIEHVFSPEELRKPLKNRVKSKIASYFLSVNLITIGFPVVIIIFYLSMSISTFGSLGVDSFTEEQQKILYNDFLSFRPAFKNPNIFPYGMYINADNTYILIWGLAESFISVSIYLAFFIKWSTRLVLKPVNHLLKNMQITGKGNMGNYAVVRSNDEIGLLAAEYNNMSESLKNYFNELDDLNKNLEKKVIERTQKIREQKEEIESQRDTLIDKNNEIESQNEEIILQRDRLQVQQKEIRDSINYAKRIQEAVMPDSNIFSEEQLFILLKPRDIVSGDFHYQAKIGDKKIIAAADCTGHGVPGAFMSMLGITFLNEIFKHEFDSAADVLNKLRKLVKEALKQEDAASVQKDGMDAALCIIDEKAKRINYAGAYNPLYRIRRGELEVYKATRNPVGVYIKEKTFENHEIEYREGDTFYMFSDGFQDQLGGEKGRKFKVKRLKEMLCKHAELPLKKQEQTFNQIFTDWRGSEEQLDDVLLIGFRL